MARVELSPLARHDILSIRDFIEPSNPRAADELIDLFDEALALIAGNSNMGEARPDFGAGVRIFTVKNYVAVYKYVDGGIHVARILHGARDIEAILRPAK